MLGIFNFKSCAPCLAEESHVEKIELLVTKTNTLKNQLQELKTHSSQESRKL